MTSGAEISDTIEGPSMLAPRRNTSAVTSPASVTPNATVPAVYNAGNCDQSGLTPVSAIAIASQVTIAAATSATRFAQCCETSQPRVGRGG